MNAHEQKLLEALETIDEFTPQIRQSIVDAAREGLLHQVHKAFNDVRTKTERRNAFISIRQQAEVWSRILLGEEI